MIVAALVLACVVVLVQFALLLRARRLLDSKERGRKQAWDEAGYWRSKAHWSGPAGCTQVERTSGAPMYRPTRTRLGPTSPRHSSDASSVMRGIRARADSVAEKNKAGG